MEPRDLETMPPVVLAPDVDLSVPVIEDPEILPEQFDSRLDLLDALADSADGAMTVFQSLARDFEEGTLSCETLQRAYIAVDSRWLSYVVNGVSRLDGELGGERADRHETLTADMQRVEITYEVTGCPLP